MAVELPLQVPGGEEPLHARIAAAVRRVLHERGLEPGTTLPTALSLAEQLEVNVNTVLRAYRTLASEGLIEVRRGHGPILRSSPEQARLHELADALVEEAHRLGLSRGELAALVLDRS